MNGYSSRIFCRLLFLCLFKRSIALGLGVGLGLGIGLGFVLGLGLGVGLALGLGWAVLAKRYSLFVIFGYSNKNGGYLHLIFLDASVGTHLYKRVCPSVRRSVRPSVGPSVRP